MQQRNSIKGEVLEQKKCKPCEGGVAPLTEKEAQALLENVKNWTLKEEGRAIIRNFHFKNYYETIAFVNAVAWISHQEDHHPDLEVTYHDCRVRYSTHAINGLSENDFICAAKVNLLIEEP